MRFIPVEFCHAHRTIVETYFRDAFSFSPPAKAVAFSQTVDFPDRISHRDGLNFRYRAEKFKPHS